MERRKQPETRRRRVGPRRGLTMVELLVSSAIMAMMAAALGTLALAVNLGNERSRGQGLAVQHGRVALDRIRANCLKAYVSPQFPGLLVVSEPVGTWTFPDTLVIWRTDTPVNPTGLPLFKELVIYAPDPAAPNRLLEVTAPTDTRQTPAASNASQWRAELTALYARTSTKKTQLTNLVRTPKIDANARRAAVRFRVALRPSEDEWSRYTSGQLTWNNLSWAQSIRGSQLGLRQTWCSMELQLLPGAASAAADPEGDAALTFFGSAALYTGMTP